MVKFFYLAFFIGLPILFGNHSLSAVFLGVAIQQIAASLVFVFTICLNHYVCETTFFTAHPDRTHLEHQLIASADWNPTSKLYCWVVQTLTPPTTYFPAFRTVTTGGSQLRSNNSAKNTPSRTIHFRSWRGLVLISGF
jgi:hypothetical protein